MRSFEQSRSTVHLEETPQISKAVVSMKAMNRATSRKQLSSKKLDLPPQIIQRSRYRENLIDFTIQHQAEI